MADQPRWPRGTPVGPSGRGPGGGRFRDGGGDWADQASARMLPSLRGLIEHYATIPRLDKIRGPNDPPWGRERDTNDPTLAAEAAHNERLTAAVKKLLEGITSRDGQLRVQDVRAHQAGGMRSWHRWVDPDTGEIEDTLTDSAVYQTLGSVTIGGGIVGPRGEDRGYFSISAFLDDGPADDKNVSNEWQFYVSRFYVHLDDQEGAGRSFLNDDKSLRPGAGGGIATEVLGRLFDWGRESGFGRATIGPSDTGNYAWAALGFDFEDFASRKVAADGLMTMSAEDLQKHGLSRAAAVRGVARLRLAAAQVLAGTMSAHRLSQLGRREGQGRDDMWLGKAAILFAGWGGGVYDLRRTRGRL